MNIRKILDESPIGVSITALATGNRLWVNRRLVEMFGAETKLEMLTMDVADSWVDRTHYQQVLDAIARNEPIEEFEAKRIRMDGSTWWALVTIQTIDFEGQPARVAWHNDITQRKTAQKELEYSEDEKRFKGIFDVSAAGMALLTPEGDFTKVNETFTKIFGYTEAEITKMNWRDISYADEVIATETQHGNLRSRKQKNFTLDKRYIHKHGHDIWVRVVAAFLYDDDENIITGFAHYQDITKLRNARMALQDSHRRFQEFAEIAADWLWETDEKNRFTYFSDGYEKATGTRKEVLLGKTGAELYGIFKEKMRVEIDSWDELFETINQHKSFDNFTYMRKNKNGDRVVFRASGRPIFDDNGVFTGYRGTGNDITDIIDTERTARMVREAVETYPDAILLVDANDRVLFTNEKYHEVYPHFPPANEIFNYNHQDLFRMSIKAGAIDHPLALSDPEAWIVERFAEHQNDAEGSGETTHSNGLTYSYRFRRTKDGGKIHVLTDITDLKNVTQEIAIKRDELAELNKQKDRFFTIIAHDLKSPLTALLGMSHILKSKSETLTKKQVSDYSTLIHRSAEGTLKLLEDLLDWSHLQLDRLEFEPVALNIEELVNANIERHQTIAEIKNIDIISAINQPHMIYADKGMVATIFRNLVSNAIKFTRDNGKIIIDAQRQGDMIEFSVSDNGVGIPVQNIEKLFTAEDKTSTRGTRGEEGTGLGLPLCMELVKKQGGKIQVESIEGEGAIFRVFLPIFYEEIAAPSSASAH